MYEFWTVFLSFLGSFIVFEPFYIMVASAFVFGIIGIIGWLLGGEYR